MCVILYILAIEKIEVGKMFQNTAYKNLVQKIIKLSKGNCHNKAIKW